MVVDSTIPLVEELVDPTDDPQALSDQTLQEKTILVMAIGDD